MLVVEEWDFQNIKIQSFILMIDAIAFKGPKSYGYSLPLDFKGVSQRCPKKCQKVADIYERVHMIWDH